MSPQRRRDLAPRGRANVHNVQMHRYASHLVRHAEPGVAVEVAADNLLAALGGEQPTLVIVTASNEFRDHAEDLRSTLLQRFPRAQIAGAVIAGGVIGVAEEVERGAAVSLLAAVLPADQIVVSALDDAADLPDEGGVVVLFADPFSVPAESLITLADQRGIELVGGFTGGVGYGQARLITTERILTTGAVGVQLTLPGVTTIVSQGARPIGSDLVVTAAERNIVLELAGKPAVEQLHAVLNSLSPDDLILARKGLMAGIVIDENRPDYDVGDFLVRGLLGVEPDSGGLAIAAEPRVGQTFRFHVRDGVGADQDLRRAIAAQQTPPGAALLFACNGRGRQMFDVDHHDAAVVQELLDVPLTGAFCQGELGPVTGANYVHAFTATMLTFPR